MILFPAPNIKGPDFFSAAEFYGYSCGQPGIFRYFSWIATLGIYVYNIPQPGKKYPCSNRKIVPLSRDKNNK
jgi:dihydrodipicolinate synthase/N-acetylneuraminate lyase